MGCLPSGCLPRGCLPRGCLPRGVCLRGCLPGRCLPRGGCVWQTPRLPGPEADTPQTRGRLPLGPEADTPPPTRGRHNPLPSACWDAHPPRTESLTDMCKNITFPQLRLFIQTLCKSSFSAIKLLLLLLQWLIRGADPRADPRPLAVFGKKLGK